MHLWSWPLMWGLGSAPGLQRSLQCLYRWVGLPSLKACVCVCAPHPGLTFEHGADPPDPQATLTCKLAKGELHEEKRDPAEYQHDEVGEHEGTWQTRRGLAQGWTAGPTLFLLRTQQPNLRSWLGPEEGVP